MKQLKPLFIYFIILLIIAIGLKFLPKFVINYWKLNEGQIGGIEKLEEKYGREIDHAAEKYKIDPSFLRALAMLECAGKNPVKPRFEPHIFEKLKQVKTGKIDDFEGIKPEMLKDADDDAIKNLASSWGPFQLMGYKCFVLGVEVKDIRGDKAIDNGVKWIDVTYGSYLKRKKFKDAFHIHNAGRPFPSHGIPLTHDKKYCFNGLKYMKKFDK